MIKGISIWMKNFNTKNFISIFHHHSIEIMMNPMAYKENSCELFCQSHEIFAVKT